MIERAICEAVFREAVIACDPAGRVREALEREPLHGGEVIGLAIGKAAFGMARGAGPVARGVIVTTDDAQRRGRSADDPKQVTFRGVALPSSSASGAVPPGWVVMASSHPVPSERSVAAAKVAMGLVESATAQDVVLALISGGASSLVEIPIDGVALDEVRTRVGELMASGASIQEINALRTQLSAIKGGKLAERSAAPVVTLVVSDVISDDPTVIGSGPTVRGWPVPEPEPDELPFVNLELSEPKDRVEIVAPMSIFGEEVTEALIVRGIAARRIVDPISADVATVADRLVRESGVIVAWGEPTVRVPDDHGSGGRAQQLALELAKRLRGTDRCAFVAGSDGVDGPSPRGAAGAYVDGTTWDAIVAAKLDPEAALVRCDAGTVLERVGALVVTGPTGINHADIVVLG